MIEITCDACGKKMKVPEEHVGRRGRCPGCRTVFIVKRAEAVAEVPVPHASEAEPVSSDLDVKASSSQVARPLSPVDAASSLSRRQNRVVWMFVLCILAGTILVIVGFVRQAHAKMTYKQVRALASMSESHKALMAIDRAYKDENGDDFSERCREINRESDERERQALAKIGEFRPPIGCLVTGFVLIGIAVAFFTLLAVAFVVRPSPKSVEPTQTDNTETS